MGDACIIGCPGPLHQYNGGDGPPSCADPSEDELEHRSAAAKIASAALHTATSCNKWVCIEGTDQHGNAEATLVE